MKVKMRQTGFTLIELLVVISIIGILMTIATVNFIGVRERARDAERKSDISQLQTALEFYRTDTTLYPTALPVCDAPLQSSSTTIYLKKSPCDPSKKSKYNYAPNASLTSYSLSTCLENENDPDRVTTNSSCSPDVYYEVTSP